MSMEEKLVKAEKAMDATTDDKTIQSMLDQISEPSKKDLG